MTDKPKNPAAVGLGRNGGRKGGPARAAKLSPEERKRIARLAAETRWRRHSEPKLKTAAALKETWMRQNFKNHFANQKFFCYDQRAPAFHLPSGPSTGLHLPAEG